MFKPFFLFIFVSLKLTYATLEGQCAGTVDFCNSCTQTIVNLTPNNSTWNFNDPTAIVCITGTINSNVTININGSKVCFKSTSKFIGNATINVLNNSDVIVESGAQANPSADLTINGGQLVNCSGDFNPTLHGTTNMCPCTTLPVQLMDFKVNNRTNNSVDVHWTIADEYSNSHFEIETFINNQWSLIKQINSEFPNPNYKVTLDIGENHRLFKFSSVDFDGSKYLLKTFEVNDFDDISHHFIFNSTTNMLTIQDIQEDFYIINSLGITVFSGSSDLKELDISAWNNGVYIIILGNRYFKFAK